MPRSTPRGKVSPRVDAGTFGLWACNMCGKDEISASAGACPVCTATRGRGPKASPAVSRYSLAQQLSTVGEAAPSHALELLSDAQGAGQRRDSVSSVDSVEERFTAREGKPPHP